MRKLINYYGQSSGVVLRLGEIINNQVEICLGDSD